MATFRVKPNQRLPHHGAVLEAGTAIDLPRHVGYEFPHLVEEIDTDGHVVAPPDAWQLEADRFQQHERLGVLRASRLALSRRLEMAEDIAAREEGVADRARGTAQALHDELTRLDAAIASADAPRAAGVEPEKPAEKRADRGKARGGESARS